MTEQNDEAKAHHEKSGLSTQIDRTPISQTVMAVAFLILATLLTFLSVTFLGPLIGNNQATYWLIELTFALLCAGAGALVGGSADVRSTFNIPGSPTRARLGGAIAMVVVGFAVASAGKPADTREPTYSIEIQNVRPTLTIDGVPYNLYVGSGDDNVSILRKGNVVAVTIPSTVQEYKVNLSVFTTKDDNAKIFVRCPLTFSAARGPVTVAQEVAPENDQQFRLYLSLRSITTAVHDAVRTGRATDREPCVTGEMTTNHDGRRKLLSGYFTLTPVNAESRLVDTAAHFRLTPSFAVMASDPDEDLPPTPSAGGGVLAQEPTPPSPKPAPTPTPSPIEGPNPSHPEPTPPPSEQTTKVPTVPSPSESASTSTLEAQVDAYVRGQNLDRTKLYQSWDAVATYVMQGLRSRIDSGSPLAARYVNLIANALNVIDDDKYRAPTNRPDWDQSVKSTRLSKNNLPPGFEPDDYKRIVGLLCSTDADSRNASQRLLKLYPADNFYQPIQDLSKQANCDLTFVAKSAVYYFYNRIVEYDGTFPIDSESRNWLDGNYSDGQKWVKLLAGKDSSEHVFSALLDYGYGIILWDRLDTANAEAATGYFKAMLQTLATSSAAYPSNPEHIATALNDVFAPQHTSKLVASATSYNASALHPIGENYVLEGTELVLFALPEISSKRVGTLDKDQSVRIYLRSRNWDLVQSGAQIGWAQEAVTNAKN